MIRQIKQRLPGVEVTQADDPLTVSLKGGGRPAITLNFASLRRLCLQSTAKECAKMRRDFLDTMLRVRPPPTPASLRIAIRHADDIAQVPGIVAEPIGEDLFAVLVSDAPDSMATVSPDALVALKLTRKQAWARAWQQTRAGLPRLPSGSALARNPVFFMDQSYLASLLADIRAWTAIAKAAGPNLFVTVVADHSVFAGVIPDGPGLDRFKQSVREDCASQPRCISPHLYRFRDGRWVISR